MNDQKNIKNNILEIKKKKCDFCNKKIGLIPFVCKCDSSYCAKCRLPSEHKCTFDFKTNGREKINKDNPKITSSKINKI